MPTSSSSFPTNRLGILSYSVRSNRDARWPYAALGGATLLFFYLHLFRFPFVPIFHPGDQTEYLEHAERMLHGEVLYRDLFQFNLPGTEYLYEFLFHVFGVHMWVGNLALLLTLTAVTIMVYALSRLVLRGPEALLPAVGFLVICQRSAIDGTHHWYSALLVLLAIYVAARFRTTVSYGFAGALLGLATIFTTTRGIAAAAGVCLFFLWRDCGGRNSFKAIAALLAPLILVVGTVLAYLAVVASPKTIFDSLIVFTLRYYPKGAANDPSIFFEQLRGAMPIRPLSVLLVLHWLAIDIVAPVVVVLFLVNCFRRRSEELRQSQRRQTLLLYAFAGGCALLAVAGAPSAPRLNCGAAFAYILATAMLVELGKRGLIVAALVVALTAGVAEASVAAVRPKYVFTGPRGPIAVLDREQRDAMEWVGSMSHPGDRLFGDTNLNFVLGLPNPAGIQWVESEAYTRPEQVTALLERIEQTPTRLIVWEDDDPAGARPGDSLAPFRAYLRLHYHLAPFHGENFLYILNGS